eukprot:1136170-Pelagomonas_calceolata.AAC.8
MPFKGTLPFEGTFAKEVKTSTEARVTPTVGSWPYASTRASRVHLAATSRAALMRNEGGV